METAKKDESNSENQAKAQLDSIREMIAALNCDYERLEELKDERADLVDDLESAAGDYRVEQTARHALTRWDEENGEELKALQDAADCGDSNFPCTSREDAEQRIQEDPLSIQVRGDWHTPGDEEGKTPAEFEILLCTGGPAVRIIGDLNEHAEPTRARLQHQDWFTPWTELVLDHDDHQILLAYAQCFYYGE